MHQPLREFWGQFDLRYLPCFEGGMVSYIFQNESQLSTVLSRKIVPAGISSKSLSEFSVAPVAQSWLSD